MTRVSERASYEGWLASSSEEHPLRRRAGSPRRGAPPARGSMASFSGERRGDRVEPPALAGASLIAERDEGRGHRRDAQGSVENAAEALHRRSCDARQDRARATRPVDSSADTERRGRVEGVQSRMRCSDRSRGGAGRCSVARDNAGACSSRTPAAASACQGRQRDAAPEGHGGNAVPSRERNTEASMGVNPMLPSRVGNDAIRSEPRPGTRR